MIFLHLVNRSEICISYLQLLSEVEVDDIESGEVADTISNIS